MGVAQLRMPQLRMRGCGRDPGQGKRGGGGGVTGRGVAGQWARRILTPSLLAAR